MAGLPFGSASRVLAMAVAGGVALTVMAVVGPMTAPGPLTVVVQASQSKVCPALGSPPMSLVLAASGSARLDQIGIATWGSETVSGQVSRPDQGVPVLAQAATGESVSGGMFAAQPGQLMWGACVEARASQYVQLTGGPGSVLHLVNAEAIPAVLNVTVLGPAGEISQPGLRDLTVEPRTTVRVNFGELIPGATPLTVRVVNTTGRVQATGSTLTATAADLAAPVSVAKTVLIGPAPAGAASTRVLITNPATVRTTARVEILGSAGRFVAAGAERVTVEAGRTIAVDVSAAVGAEFVGLLVTAEREVAASAVATFASDIAYVPGVPLDVAARQVSAVIPRAGTLAITNPSAEAATIEIEWGSGQANTIRTIQSGATAAVATVEGAQQVRVRSSEPVIAGIIVGNAEPTVGLTVVPLQPEGAGSPTTPIEVDPRQAV